VSERFGRSIGLNPIIQGNTLVPGSNPGHGVYIAVGK